MNDQMIIDLLEKSGVIMDGHFLLTSGRHSDRFLQCSQLIQHPGYTESICRLLAEPYRGRGIETVIGPAMGGIIIAYETARILGARALYAEPSGDKMILRRGFRIEPGEKVLIVEDAISTGGSVQKVIDLLKNREADLVGVAVLVDRTSGTLKFTVPLTALLNLTIESYEPENCPLCRAGIPLHEPKGASGA